MERHENGRPKAADIRLVDMTIQSEGGYTKPVTSRMFGEELEPCDPKFVSRANRRGFDPSFNRKG